MLTNVSRTANTNRRDVPLLATNDRRAPRRPERNDADDRLDELHHRRLHACRHREDDDDPADR